MDRAKTLYVPSRRAVTIGRDLSADLMLFDGRVSRFHVRLETRADGVWVVDLNSRNGSFVNEMPIGECRLKPGDRLKVGDTTLLFIGDAAALMPAQKPKESLAKRLQTYYKAQTAPPAAPDAPKVTGPTRQLVFDVEGVLLTTEGLAAEALEQMLREICGVQRPLKEFPVAGRSEPEIVRNVMRAAGLSPDQIRTESPRALARYVALLGGQLQRRPRGQLMPGIRALLERLKEDPRWAVGLLTRNVLLSARMLLSHHGLLGHFAFGAYADERENRETLPALLLDRAQESTRVRFTPVESYFVGSLRRDIAIAKAAGFRTVAVATGGEDYETLAEVDPHLIFPSLEDVDDVLRRLNAAAFGGDPGEVTRWIGQPAPPDSAPPTLPPKPPLAPPAS
jgi:phosphoglycolate phosphatase-like HAD superfamily hydrolase